MGAKNTKKEKGTLLNSMVLKNSQPDALQKEIERNNFTRAACLAASLGVANHELKHIQHQALCQMAAEYRNTQGTKILAQQYGYSEQEVKQILEEHARLLSEKGNTRIFKPAYECITGKYLTFEKWINNCIERWHKL